MSKQPVKVATWSELEDRAPAYALVANVDLVVVRWDDQVSVLYGRCLHRGALMSDATVIGQDLVCGLHSWDYRLDTGISAYDNREALRKFDAWVENDEVFVDAAEVAAWHEEHPQPYERDKYLGPQRRTYGHATRKPMSPAPHVQTKARPQLSKVIRSN